MTKKLSVFLTVMLGFLMLLSACAPAASVATQAATSAPAAATTKDDSLTVVIIPKLVHEFYNMVYDGANTAVKELAAQGKQVNIIWSAPTTADSAEQANKLEAAIALKPDVIAISVIDGELVKPLMEQAKAQGIKVIAFDTNFEGSPANSFVGVSLEGQKQSGRQAADLLVKLIGKDTGKIAMLTGSPDAENHKLFSGGFEEQMAAKYPGFEIVTKQADNDDKEKATSLTEAILAQYPDIDGIFGGDGSAGTGAAVAVKSAVAAGQIKADQVKIIEYCLMNDSATMMREGYIQGLVDYPPYWIGYYTTMSAAADYFDNIPLKDVLLVFGEVTRDNMDTYLADYNAARAKEGLEYWKK
jgi:ABC-type sugar transport system substrate-binding protein